MKIYMLAVQAYKPRSVFAPTYDIYGKPPQLP